MLKKSAGSPITKGLSEFAHGLKFEDIPEHVRYVAKMHILDTFGVALAAASLGEANKTASSLEKFGGGKSRVPGMPHHLSTRDAVMVTGMLVHGLEFDDTSVMGRTHPSAFCAPLALTLTAQQKLDGKELITSYVAGIETSIRIGAAAKGAFPKVGFDAMSIIGPFGSALIAGRLFGLTVEQLRTSLGVAYSFCSGNREFMAELAWTKRVHPGWSAVGGITAAIIAMNDFVAPLMPFEGKFGLYNLYVRKEAGVEADLNMVTAGLGEKWLLADDLAYKPLPLCFFNIPAADAAIWIAKEYDINVADVADVTVLVPEAGIATVCEPADIRRRPTHRFAAQFSVYYSVASALIRRRVSLDDLTAESLNDPMVLDLASKITYSAYPNSTFPKYYCSAVIVKMKDGRIFEKREDIHRGCPDRPLTEEEVVIKFDDNARRVHSKQQTDRIRDVIMNLEKVKDTRELENLLAVERASQPIPSWNNAGTEQRFYET